VWRSDQAAISVLAVTEAPGELQPLVGTLGESGLALEIARNRSGVLSPEVLRRHGVVLLDDRLGDSTPLEVVRSLREYSDIAIVVVMASDSEEAVVDLLEAGADQCMTRPVRVRELVARIRAAARRASAPPAEPAAIQIDDLRLDPSGHVVSLRGRNVDLTVKEFDLLHLLVANAGQTLTRRLLIDRLWRGEANEGKTLDVFIRRIRAKIEDDPSHPTRIVTARKVGYRYQRPPTGSTPGAAG
jgi:two-component system response regulator RegX3